MWITIGCIFTVCVLAITELWFKQRMDESLNDTEERPLLGGFITVQKLYNRGAMRGLLGRRPRVLKVLSAILILVMLFWLVLLTGHRHAGLRRLALVLVLGGAGSNVYERFQKGYVVDYFSLNVKPIRRLVFNIADFMIFAGAIIMLIPSDRR